MTYTLETYVDEYTVGFAVAHAHLCWISIPLPLSSLLSLGAAL